MPHDVVVAVLGLPIAAFECAVSARTRRKVIALLADGRGRDWCACVLWRTGRAAPPNICTGMLLFRGTLGDLLACAALSLSLPMAKHIEFFAQHYRAVSNSMALASSIGGGWASVRNARMSIQYAVKLGRLAALINDDASVRKCRLFVGYGLRWLGLPAAARCVYERELRAAVRAGDPLQVHRCELALRQLHDDAAGACDCGEDAWAALFQQPDAKQR